MNVREWFSKCSLRSALPLLMWMLVAMVPTMAFGADPKDPFGDQLCSILNILSSKTVKVVCICGVLFVGFQVMTGRTQWPQAVLVVVAIVTVGKAETLVILVIGGNEKAICAQAAP